MKPLQFDSNVRHAGGSKYVRIPSNIANSMKLLDGEPVTVEVVNDKELRVIFG